METISKGNFTLKQIFEDNLDRFVSKNRPEVNFSAAYNVWKVMNCREPDGLGYATFACPDHPEQVTHIPRTCKSRFCPVCSKIQVDKWVADMNRLFPGVCQHSCPVMFAIVYQVFPP
uniref:Transposase zinc-binding domain-containing protein n=1 Tax=Candidatus Kentrum sp. SD TaxID=2126332 RepID=A0A450YYS2_9GAMM|nr:MAG: Transposase zinc-binding domain-containing protein [Candidatus Kentron sp. SD]VFK49974.1 MAG: Transposase zinc-binding domain-containing protein [Candidatus Kentron sp. SD]